MTQARVQHWDNLLHGGTNRAEYNCEVKRAWLAPLVKHLVAQGRDLSLGQIRNGFKLGGIASNESSLFKLREDVAELVFLREMLDITKDLVFGKIGQRVLDSKGGEMMLLRKMMGVMGLGVKTYFAETLFCRLTSSACPFSSTL